MQNENLEDTTKNILVLVDIYLSTARRIKFTPSCATYLPMIAYRCFHLVTSNFEIQKKLIKKTCLPLLFPFVFILHPSSVLTSKKKLLKAFSSSSLPSCRFFSSNFFLPPACLPFIVPHSSGLTHTQLNSQYFIIQHQT